MACSAPDSTAIKAELIDQGEIGAVESFNVWKKGLLMLSFSVAIHPLPRPPQRSSLLRPCLRGIPSRY